MFFYLLFVLFYHTVNFTGREDLSQRPKPAPQNTSIPPGGAASRSGKKLDESASTASQHLNIQKIYLLQSYDFFRCWAVIVPQFLILFAGLLRQRTPEIFAPPLAAPPGILQLMVGQVEPSK
jgi:hypothetical protein